MDTPTKPLQKLEKKDMVAQIANIKSTNCFSQTNSPNITLANKYSCTVTTYSTAVRKTECTLHIVLMSHAS